MANHELDSAKFALLQSEIQLFKSMCDIDETIRDTLYYNSTQSYLKKRLDSHRANMDNMPYDQFPQVDADIEELRNVMHGLKLLERIKIDQQVIVKECKDRVNFHKNIVAKLTRRHHAKFVN